MKNFFKWRLIIAFIAVIGFSLASCGDSGGGGSTPADNSGSDGGGYGSGGYGSGDGGIIYWNEVETTTFGSDYIDEIACGDGKFVAISGVKMAYSSDGVNWSAVSDIGLSYYEIVYGNGKFVVRDNNKIAYSSNGASWTVVKGSSIFGSDNLIERIYFVNDKFFIIKTYSFDDDTSIGGNWIQTRKIAHSTDCVTWTLETFSNTNLIFSYSDPITDFVYAYGNGKFVATPAVTYTNSGKIIYSSDGINWTEVTDTKFGNNKILGITYGSNKFVAVGEGGLISYSSDGINWTAANSKVGNYEIRRIAYGNGKFIALSLFTNEGIYSSDGITWYTCRFDHSISDITFGNGKFIGWGKVSTYSPSYIAWTTGDVK